MKLDVGILRRLPALTLTELTGLTGRLRRLSPTAMAALIIVGMAALSLLVGALSGMGRNNIALAIAGGPAVVFVVWFLLNRFDVALLLLPILALAVPLDLPTGTYSKVPISLALALVLCGIWVTSNIIRSGRQPMAPSPLNRPLLVFSVMMIISMVWGLIWRDPVLNMALFKNFEVVQIASLLTYLVSIGVALLIGNYVRTSGRLAYIHGAFIFFGSIMTILQLLKIEHGIFTDRGLWGLWTIAPALGLLLTQPRMRWYWRVLIVLLIAGNLYQTMIVNLLWKSGWIPTVVAVFVAILMRSWRWFLVLLVICSVAVYVERDFFYQMVEAELHEGAGERVGMWEINLRVVSEHWLFGTGPAGYAPYYMTYYPNDARSTHNNYLDIIAQFGLLGTLAWLWLAAVSTIEGVRLYLRAPPGLLRTTALIVTSGWVGAQVSMFFGDWLLPFAYNQTITGFKYTVFTWIYLGMLISLRQMLTQEAGARPEMPRHA